MAKPVKEKQEGATTAKPATASAYADFAEAMAGNPLVAQSTAAMAAATAVGMSIAGQFAGAFFGALQGALEAQNRMTGSPERAAEAPWESKPEPEQSAKASVPEPAKAPTSKRRSIADEAVRSAAKQPAKMREAKPASDARTKKSAVRKPKVTTADNLKQIAGIGPKLEKVLNGQGISSISQIAAWTDADVAKFDDALGLDGRIRRDDWVGQARKLAK